MGRALVEEQQDHAGRTLKCRPAGTGIGTGTKPLTGRSVLARAISSQRRRVAGGSLLFMAHQAAEAAVPVMAGIVIDRAVVTGDLGALVRWIAGLALLFGVLSMAYRHGARLVIRAREGALHELLVAVARRVLDPSGGVETNTRPGELVNIATSDVLRAAAVNEALPLVCASVAALASAATVLLWISVPLGLLVLVGLPPVLGLLQLLVKPLERRFSAQQADAANAAGVATDLITGLRVVKGLGAEAAAATRYRLASQQSLVASLRAARVHSVHTGLTFALTGTFLAVVALVGGRLATTGRISVGDLVASVGLTQFLIGPLLRIAFATTELAGSRASAERVAAVLAAPSAVVGGTESVATPAAGELRLRGLSHGPLHDLTLAISSGEIVGVVASDPAHTAVLLDCLARSLDPATGVVELDGTDLRALDLDDLRANLLVAAHDAQLFEGRLVDNVLAAAPDLTPDRLDAVLRASAADEVAATLPNGADSVVTERGRSLSGGQRQRVALARALAVDTPVLVLHDPTTAVDAATEARIAAGLRAVRAGQTTVIVTTSPALLVMTDRVIVLDGGGVVTEGTHAELVQGDESYRRVVLA